MTHRASSRTARAALHRSRQPVTCFGDQRRRPSGYLIDNVDRSRSFQNTNLTALDERDHSCGEPIALFWSGDIGFAGMVSSVRRISLCAAFALASVNLFDGQATAMIGSVVALE